MSRARVRAGVIGLLLAGLFATDVRAATSGSRLPQKRRMPAEVLSGMDAFTYLSAKFAGYIPADRDSVVSSLVELGLRYEERASGSGWVRSNSMGEMSAGTALPAARMVILSFKPAKVSPIPASVLSVLQGKAGWILIGMPSPGEMSLVFDQDDLFGNRENSWTSIRDEMYVRIQDGAWYETDRTISWKGSRP